MTASSSAQRCARQRHLRSRRSAACSSARDTERPRSSARSSQRAIRSQPRSSTSTTTACLDAAEFIKVDPAPRNRCSRPSVHDWSSRRLRRPSARPGTPWVRLGAPLQCAINHCTRHQSITLSLHGSTVRRRDRPPVDAALSTKFIEDLRPPARSPTRSSSSRRIRGRIAGEHGERTHGLLITTRPSMCRWANGRIRPAVFNDTNAARRRRAHC